MKTALLDFIFHIFIGASPWKKIFIGASTHTFPLFSFLIVSFIVTPHIRLKIPVSARFLQAAMLYQEIRATAKSYTSDEWKGSSCIPHNQ